MNTICIKVPDDANRDESPYRRVIVQTVPRVGDLLSCDDLPHILIVTEVMHHVTRNRVCADVAEDVTVTCDWHYA